MNWLVIVTVAYFLNAISIAINKALIKKEVPSPAAYTFYISALGALAIVLLPFDFNIPSWDKMIWNFLSGAAFTAALYFMMLALKKEDASRVTPFIGGLGPFFIFILAYLFLAERLAGNQVLAFAVILIGTFLISFNFRKHRIGRIFLIALPAVVFFAISYVLAKYVYLEQNFLSAFIWIRVGAFIAALVLLIPAKYRRAIFGNIKKSSEGSKWIFGLGQAAGAGSAILQNWAIALASVSLVNALQGLQYVFLFIIVLLLKNKHPKLLDEDLSRKVYIQKVVSIILIVVGLFLISIS